MPLENVEVPLPGKVIDVNVSSGDKVNEGDELCTIESMKMENPVLAPVSGVITEVSISQGQMVKAGSTIAVIEY